jgi:hypothetical protein
VEYSPFRSGDDSERRGLLCGSPVAWRR